MRVISFVGHDLQESILKRSPRDLSFPVAVAGFSLIDDDEKSNKIMMMVVDACCLVERLSVSLASQLVPCHLTPLSRDASGVVTAAAVE